MQNSSSFLVSTTRIGPTAARCSTERAAKLSDNPWCELLENFYRKVRGYAAQQKSRYSITSSARASRVGEISMPIALAAFRLKTRSDDFGGLLALAVCVVACPLVLVVMMCGS